MKKISYSSPYEAIQKAREIFAAHPGQDWVIATDDETVGGVLGVGLHGDLVLHRCGYRMYTGSRTVEETKTAILAALVNACAGVNPEAVPELLHALQALARVTQEALAGDYDEEETREALDDALAAISRAVTRP